MNNIIYLICICWGLGFSSLIAQVVPTPAPPQTQGIVIQNATIHVGDGTVIQNGSVAFSDGKITTVDPDNGAPTGFRAIDASGKHLYPGFILPNTELGLVEIGAVRASVDAAEKSDFTPEVRTIVAYNTDSHVIPTTRNNGILMAQIAPSGGGISGNTSVVQLDAWNWEDAVLKMDEGLKMSWPLEYLRPRWWLGETGSRPNPEYAKTIQMIEELMQDAAAYAKTTDPMPKNLKLEALKGLFDGSKTLYVQTDRAKAIIKAVGLLERYGVQKIVIIGGGQAWYAKDFLKEHNIPVLIRNVHSLPTTEEEDVDMPFRLPGLLHQAGILVGLEYSRYSSARNLPFFAGTAAAYGLSKEEALMAITLNTAKILGMEDQVGSITVGKDATLFLSEGDALDMRTNLLTHAFIQGREIDLDDKHQMLYRRFKEKYERMGE